MRRGLESSGRERKAGKCILWLLDLVAHKPYAFFSAGMFEVGYYFLKVRTRCPGAPFSVDIARKANVSVSLGDYHTD